jgi:predicted nucleic acid-binding protein
MKTIISNTSPIIALSMIGKLQLLWELFNRVYVPKAVLQELKSSTVGMIMEEQKFLKQ